jgi:hypothetical protein
MFEPRTIVKVIAGEEVKIRAMTVKERMQMDLVGEGMDRVGKGFALMCAAVSSCVLKVSDGSPVFPTPADAEAIEADVLIELFNACAVHNGLKMSAEKNVSQEPTPGS